MSCFPSLMDHEQYAPTRAQHSFFFFKILFIYSWEIQRKKERQRHRQREKQAPCREPDVGLDPGSPGSRPGPKAAPNCWAIRAALKTSMTARWSTGAWTSHSFSTGVWNSRPLPTLSWQPSLFPGSISLQHLLSLISCVLLSLYSNLTGDLMVPNPLYPYIWSHLLPSAPSNSFLCAPEA